MLEVETYIHRSDIAGNGVFTAYAIPKGTVVWRDSELNHVVVLNDSTNPNRKAYVKNFGYLTENGWILCADNAKFMNHSDDPNLMEVIMDGSAVNVAARDIQADEELTCDYWHFDRDAGRKLGRV